LPIYKGLVERGVPATAAIALLIAAPELGIDAVILSVTLLDGPFAIARVLAAGTLALLVGWGLGRWVSQKQSAVGGRQPPRIEGPPRERLRQGLRAGFVELVDDTAPWLLLGLAIAAVAWPLLGGSWLEGIPPHLQVPVFALLGLPMYVCASGATPIAAVLVAQGVSPGAALAFLLTGPATNVTTFGILTQLHGRKVAIAFALTMAIGAIGLGIAVDAGVGSVETHFDRRGESPQTSLASESDHDHDHSHQHDHAHAHDHRAADGDESLGLGEDPLRIGALVLLTALFVSSLLRQGPRGFVGQVIAPPDGDHQHGLSGGSHPPASGDCCH